MIRKMYQKINELYSNGQAFAVVTVVKVEGSTPGKLGMKLLVMEDGSTYGTVGGGCQENLVIKESLRALKEGKSRTIDYALKEPWEDEKGIGMVCGGSMQVFIDVHPSRHELITMGSGHLARKELHPSRGSGLLRWLGWLMAT